MKHYFYADNNQQFGPFTVDELKSKRLKKTTLVWTDGMSDWTMADSIDELRDFLVSEPPPLPKQNKISPKIETVQIKHKTAPTAVFSSKYDLTYKKETDATLFGIILFIVLGVIHILVSVGEINISPFYGAGLLTIRFLVTPYVVNIASRQNRNEKVWGWFAFFFPSIALIIIGQLKKLKLKIELDSSLLANQQVSILFEKANKLFSKGRYLECVEVLNVAIELDNLNFECIELRGQANYEIKNYKESKLDFETLLENEKFLPAIYFYIGNFAIMDKDRELAVSYWLKARKLGHEGAQIKLDLYHTFTGNYLLTDAQAFNKTSIKSWDFLSHFAKYQGGLPQIDQIIGKKLPINVDMRICDNGIDVTLKKRHLGIAYYEIDKIVFRKMEKKIELHLLDGYVLTFDCYYNGHADNNLMLGRLYKNFEEATGKKPH